MGCLNSYALFMPVSVPLPIVSIKIGYNGREKRQSDTRICAEVNGTKPKSLRTGQEIPYKQQKSRERSAILTRLSKFFYKCFQQRFCNR